MVNSVGRASSGTVSTRSIYVQTDRKAHEAWAKLCLRSPRAASLLHVLLGVMDAGDNAVLMSQKALSRISSMSVSTIKRALEELEAMCFIEIIQVGERGTVNAYRLNSRVAWAMSRDDIRYAKFTATIVALEEEQKRPPTSGDLVRMPTVFPGERQVAAGDGLPPPSEPNLPGMEPDLPSMRSWTDDDAAIAIGSVLRDRFVDDRDPL